MSSRIPVCRVALLLTLAAALRAQTVRGLVFMPDSVTPAAGIVITAIAENGKGAGSALSNSTGDYSMRVVAPGRYQLRALQIGFRPTVVAGVDVVANGVRVQNIVLGRQAVNLAAILVQDEGCGISQRDGDTFLQLWEQARAALSAATRLSEQSGALDVRLVRIAGHVDATGYVQIPSPSRYPILPHAAIDSANARDVMVDAVIAATPAETLATAGYVRRHDLASVIFDIPSAEALLSDDFAAQHCFGIAKPPDEHPEWIGIRFAPRQKRGDVTDVRGVLWLDRNSAELRRLEFTYANLPRTSYEVCDDVPEDVPVAERKRRCQQMPDDGANRLGLGGEADFQRLPTGEWLITSWTIRKPPDEGKYRKAFRCQQAGRKCEPCYFGPQCKDVWLIWPRLVTTAGTISRITRGETELYRNDSSLAFIDRIAMQRAGNRPASIEGRVTSADGRPLSSAIIQTDDPARVGRTDTSGAFRIRALPPGPIGILVRCRGYEPAQFKLLLLPDSTRRLSLALTTAGNASRTSASCAESVSSVVATSTQQAPPAPPNSQTRRSTCRSERPQGTPLALPANVSAVESNASAAVRTTHYVADAAGLSGGEIAACTENGRVEIADSDDDHVRIQVLLGASGDGAANPVVAARHAVEESTVRVYAYRNQNRLIVHVWNDTLGFVAGTGQPASVSIRIYVPRRGTYRVLTEAYPGPVAIRRLALSGGVMRLRSADKFKGDPGYPGSTELDSVQLGGNLELTSDGGTLSLPLLAKLQIVATSTLTVTTGGDVTIAVAPDSALGVRAFGASADGAVSVLIGDAARRDTTVAFAASQFLEQTGYAAKPIRLDVKATTVKGRVSIASVPAAPTPRQP